MSDYPQPRVDADNRAYLDGWASGRLMIQRCRACGAAFHYPRPCCPACFAADPEWAEASGQGRVVTFSRVWRPNDSAFNDETPILLCEIALDEGPTMLARVLAGDGAQVEIGSRVALSADELGRRYPLPIFALVQA